MTDTPSGGRAALEALFARLGIAPQTIEHPPVHTVEEAMPYWSGLDALHTKNLFLKDARGQLWLVVLPCERRADLKAMAATLGAKKFSFASAETLESVLGVRQGAVSPLALVNDAERRVRLALDRSLVEANAVSFHPLENTATVALSGADFARFLAALGYEPALLEPEGA
jgi:Ala-tRNA(Pro) deacylase